MVPLDRSMNFDLTDGMTDGKVKKSNPNRGGLPEHATTLHREILNTDYDTVPEPVDISGQRPDVVGLMP